MVLSTSPDPHAVLAALSDAERRSASDGFTTKRQFARHSLRGEAILQTIEDASVEMRTLRVQLRDISLTGIGFVSGEPLPAGSVWRVTFVVRNVTMGQHALTIRHSRRIDHGTYLSGGQFCIEPGLLHVMGVDPAMLNRDDDGDFVESNAFLPEGRG